MLAARRRREAGREALRELKEAERWARYAGCKGGLKRERNGRGSVRCEA